MATHIRYRYHRPQNTHKMPNNRDIFLHRTLFTAKPPPPTLHYILYMYTFTQHRKRGVRQTRYVGIYIPTFLFIYQSRPHSLILVCTSGYRIMHIDAPFNRDAFLHRALFMYIHPPPRPHSTIQLRVHRSAKEGSGRRATQASTYIHYLPLFCSSGTWF